LGRSVLEFLINLLPLSWRPRKILEMRQRASQWHALRAKHLEREPQCMACGRRENVVVHHIIPVSFDEDKELSETNLITLCAQPCHIVFGHFMNFKCYNKDVRKMTAEYKKACQKRKCLKS
jgi:hypothetical protein